MPYKNRKQQAEYLRKYRTPYMRKWRMQQKDIREQLKSELAKPQPSITDLRQLLGVTINMDFDTPQKKKVES